LRYNYTILLHSNALFMKKMFLLVFFVSNIGFTQSESQANRVKLNTQESVLFDYDQFILTNNAKAKLDAVISRIDIAQLQSVELNGNTDADGNSKYNLTLSKNRANEVLNYLVAKGIPTEKIRLRFDGENKPVAENASENGKQQNRRVEITFAFTEKEYTNTIFSQLEKESQFFTGKSNEVITVKGKEGTEITIPKNALIKANGKYALGKIDIELKEFYKKSDVIGANLHTMSNGIMLESGGMIYVKASSKGEELQLKKGSEMTIGFASKINPSGMKTFYGYPQKDKSIDWNTNAEVSTIKSKNDGELEWIEYIISYTEKGENIKDTVYGDLKKYPKRVLTEGEKKALEDAKKTIALENTFLKATKLGWINCDRFSEAENKTDLIVNIDRKYNAEIRLVFKDINSIMSTYNINDKLVIKSIPVGQKATLMAFSCVNDEVYFVAKEIVIGKNNLEELSMNKTTVEEFKIALQQFN